MKSSWWLDNQKRYVLLLLVLAAIFETIYKVNDTHITHNLISNTDKLLVASCYLIIGGAVGLVVNFVFSNTRLGQVVDPAFGKIKLPNKAVLGYAIASGFLSALSTLFLLWGSSLYDPGVVSALAGATVLFVMLWELYKGRISFADYIFPALLVFIGGAMATADLTKGIQISVVSILLLLVGKNLIGAASNLMQKEAVQGDNATNFTFWRFLALVISGAVIAFIIALFRGNVSDLVDLMKASFWQMLPFVLITMVFVYFSNGFQAVSTKYLPVTTISIIGSLPIVLGLFLGLGVNVIWPSTFKDLPTDSSTIVVRIVGSIVIIVGVALLKELKSRGDPK